MQILYHPDDTISKINTPQLKSLSINFLNWYCPIHRYVWLMRHDGTLKSGTCGQNVIHNEKYPFWSNRSPIKTTNNFCKANRGACSCGSDLDSPKAISKKIYKEFVKKIRTVGWDVEKSLSDYDGKKIIAIGRLNKILDRTAEIHMDIGKKCNFDCSYCPSGVHDNFSPFMSLETINNGLNIIEKHSGIISNKTGVITGGEPTLFKELPELLQLLKEKNFNKIKINTNGTGSYQTYSNILQNKNISLELSFHYEFTTEKIIKKCSKLKEEFNDQIFLKVLSRTTDFVDTVNQHTTKYEQFPIYEKETTKHIIVQMK